VALSSPRPVTGSLEESHTELEALLVLTQAGPAHAQVISGWDAEAAVLVKRGESVLGRDGHFVFSKLSVLEEHDRSHGTQFVETISCVLRLGWNISRAAAALQIHHTTLRYRMTRIGEICQFNVDDPLERLAANLHLLAVGKALQVPVPGLLQAD
jgi:sugar diacid utilization regulator